MSSNEQISGDLNNQQRNLSSCDQQQGDGTKKLISIDGTIVRLPLATAKHLKKYALSPNSNNRNNNDSSGIHCIAASAPSSSKVVIRHKAKKLSSVDENDRLMEDEWLSTMAESAGARQSPITRSNSLGTKSSMEVDDTVIESTIVKDDDSADTVAFRSSNKKCRRGNSVRFSDHLDDNDAAVAAAVSASIDYAADDEDRQFVGESLRHKTSLPAVALPLMTSNDADADDDYEAAIFAMQRQRSLAQRHKFSMPAYGTPSAATKFTYRSIDDSYRSGGSGCGRTSPRLFLYQSRRRPTTSSNTLYSLSTEYLRAAGYQTPPFCKLLSIKRKKGTVLGGRSSFDVEQQRQSTGRMTQMVDSMEQSSARRLLSLDDKQEYSPDVSISGALSQPPHFSKNNLSHFSEQDYYSQQSQSGKKSLTDRRKISNFFFHQNRCVSESANPLANNQVQKSTGHENFSGVENLLEIGNDKKKRIEFSVSKKISNVSDLEKNANEEKGRKSSQPKNLRSRYSYGRVYVQDSLTQKMLFKKRRSLFENRLIICKFSLLFAALGLLLAVLETEMTSSGATSKQFLRWITWIPDIEKAISKEYETISAKFPSTTMKRQNDEDVTVLSKKAGNIENSSDKTKNHKRGYGFVIRCKDHHKFDNCDDVNDNSDKEDTLGNKEPNRIYDIEIPATNISWLFDEKKDFGSYLIRATITFTTLILDGLILAYHWIEIKISMIDITAHDWRVVITSRDIMHLVVEIIVCSICPIPVNITINWVILSPHHRRTRLTIVPLDSVLAIIMFLRCYLIGRFMALNSVQFKDAATRSIARLNRVTVNFAFVMKSLMSRHPIRVLSGFTVMFWICMSWILAQCERFTNIPADNDYLNCVWFVVITFMSIGYGDVVPATYCGRTVAITTGIVGAGVSSALIAVMSLKLELSRAEKHVNNFMTDTKLNRQRKEAAASILQHTWFIHKWKTAANYAEEAKLRYHQRKLIGAISEFRRVKWEQRRLMEQGNALIDVAKLQSDMSNTLWEMHQSQLALTFQINRLSHRFRLLSELVSSSTAVNKAEMSPRTADREPPTDSLSATSKSETDVQMTTNQPPEMLMINLVDESAHNMTRNTLSPEMARKQ